MKLSATIITLNEAEEIERCLASLQGLADEVVVVDSQSSDKTVELARKQGAKVYSRAFDNFANQKNFAVEKANGEWVLAVDADEVIPPELAAEIKSTIEAGQSEGYLIPRRNFILGGEIKHSWWSPDKHIWLWKRESGKWVGQVHEEVVVKGAVGELKQAKLHYQDKTISEFIAKNNRYSSLEADRLFSQGVRFSWWRMIYQAKFEFLMRYVIKQGYLDGWRGLVLAILMGVYKTQVWLKIWERQKGRQG